MTPYKTPANKDDDGLQDACPTCGGHVETKAATSASGHVYDLTCRQCPWSVPLSEPPTATTDGPRLVTDGGTMQYVAECDVCGVLDRGDLETVGDAAENHEQFHDVEIERANLPSGGGA